MKGNPLRPRILSRINPLPFAFLIPFIGVLVVLLIKQCEPFGNDWALLYSDEYHQYYPFFLEFRRALLRGDSLLYSWNVGMGMDYLGLISYYLSSPLNLLSVFVPESMVMEYFALLSPIKLGLAGLFFAIFLKKTFGKKDMSIALFGGLYATCAWALGYQWNVMWLDTFALLPLVALGTVSLLRDKKVILYTVTLFLSIFANYYIGFFVCIFVLLMFICYQICNPSGVKRFFGDLGRIALFSLLAIGMTAILELPALAALQDTFSSNNQFPTDFSLNVVPQKQYASAQNAWAAFKTAQAADAGFFTLAGKWFLALIQSFPPVLLGMARAAGQMSGELSPTRLEGLPNIACGVGSMIMAFLFFTAKDVKLREKLCTGGLLILFLLSFLLRQLDYIWHGFHFTNMIPYRFSFLYSFVVLYMAYRTWLLRDSFEPWTLIIAFAISAGVILFCEKADDWIFLAYNAAFLLLYTAAFLLPAVEQLYTRLSESELPEERLAKRQRLFRRLKAISLCCLFFLELVLILVKFSLAYGGTTITNYPTGGEAAASMFRYIKEREANSDFYRVETTHAQILNDGALNDYNGVSTFTSSANVRVTTFLEAMGLGAYPPYNRYCYEETSPVTNLFLNLKYLVERNGSPEESPCFERIHSYGGIHLLENKAYLPLGFLTESSLTEATIEHLLAGKDGKKEENEFVKQNTFFSLATGLEEDVWKLVSGHRAEITIDNVTSIKEVQNHDTAFIKYCTGSNSGTVFFTYTFSSPGYLCMEMNMGAENDYQVSLNGRELFREKISLPQVVSIGQVNPGDELVIKIDCPPDIPAEDPAAINIKAAMLNEDVFWQGYDILSASTLDLTEFSNTQVSGTIQCNRDGLLYTSIPFDGNWVAQVDGKDAEILLVGDAMMALELTAGTHTITFRYKNTALTLGAIVSAVSLMTFLCILILPPILQKAKKKPTESQDPNE